MQGSISTWTWLFCLSIWLIPLNIPVSVTREVDLATWLGTPCWKLAGETNTYSQTLQRRWWRTWAFLLPFCALHRCQLSELMHMLAIGAITPLCPTAATGVFRDYLICGMKFSFFTFLLTMNQLCRWWHQGVSSNLSVSIYLIFLLVSLFLLLTWKWSWNQGEGTLWDVHHVRVTCGVTG